MKINKVEISAFRAFDKLEDSTFDFSIDRDTTANFISIYAPNGYGKTSFYDAVEWAITGQISRFQKNAPENKKAGVENRKSNKNQYLLQHNRQKQLGFVQVFTDNNNHSFPKKNISNSTIYDFNKAPINNYFRDVVLSQDLIDTFIKEEKAEERYKKFISNIPYLNDYNTSLQNAIKLIENVDEEIKKLTQNKIELEKKQLQFDFEGESKVLEEINKVISLLISKNEELAPIEKNSFTKLELTTLTQKISSALVSLQIEIDALKLRGENVEIAFNGSSVDDNKSGLIQYYANIEKGKELSKKLIELKSFLQALDQRDLAEENRKNLNKELVGKIKLLDDTSKIKNEFERFQIIQNNISGHNKSIDANTLVIERHKDSQQNFKSILSDLKIDLTKLTEAITTQKKKLERIPSLEKQINQYNDQVDLSSKEIVSTELLINTNKDLILETTQKLDLYNFHLSNLNFDIDLLLDNPIYEGFKDKIRNVQDFRLQLSQLEKSLTNINSKIESQNSLNSELKNLITKGLELISKNNASDCPLCLAHYESYEVLSDKISRNPLIDDLLKSSLTEKSNIELSLNEINIKNSLIINEISDFIKKLIEQEQNQKIKAESELTRLKTLLERTLKMNRAQKEDKEKLIIFLEGLSINDFKRNLEAEIKTSDAKLKIIESNIEKKNTEIEALQDLIKRALSESELLKNSIEKEQQSDLYKSIVAFFKDVLKTNEVNLNNLNTYSSLISSQTNELKTKISEQEKLISELVDVLAINKLSQEQLVNDIILISNLIELNNKVTKNFEAFIQSDYKINLSNLSLQDATSEFEKIKNEISEKINSKNEVLKNYKIVESLKDKVFSFLESEKTKESIEEIKKEIGVLSRINEDLIREKIGLEKYLKETIDNFFYTKLINKIYSKIDPHPDNYKIEFDCDFKEKNPRLQIYTSDSENKKSVPSLYFSSAQINILSLSIFLARALKASDPKTKEPIECIFIDDPIQSMDSINILSFIDLFRSLIVNLDRQLIVSTHEENFHLLLQKKIPSKLFKSKFLQFETFGKLEKMANA